MDRLSDLPDIVIDKILLSMTLLDAVRTSVLSKFWEYRWTMLPKLQIDIEFFIQTSSNRDSPFDFMYIVNSVLLQHTGPLEEVYLAIPEFKPPKVYYINQFIRMVLLRGVKKLTIFNWAPRPHTWLRAFRPSVALTYFELNYCVFKWQPGLTNFHNLNSLVFDNVTCHPNTLSSFISNCPHLKRIILQNLDYEGYLLHICAPKLEYLFVRGKFGKICLQDAKNVREMELELVWMRAYPEWEMTHLIDFFGSLVGLESLRLGCNVYKLFALAGHLTKLPRGLGEMRILKLADVNFNDIGILRCILCFIRTSPNLCRLEIRATPANVRGPVVEASHLRIEGYEDFELAHLEKVYIGPIRGTENELKVIEFLLRCSPALRVLSIWLGRAGPNRVNKRNLKKALNQFYRASKNARFQISCQFSDQPFLPA